MAASRLPAGVGRLAALCALLAMLAAASAAPASAGPPRARSASEATRRALSDLRDRGLVDEAAYRRATDVYSACLRALRRLRGTRRAELRSVVAGVDGMAARHALSAGVLPAVVETLRRNLAWWTTRPLLGPGARVSFDGSEIVWQHYAGQGLQIQWLATFGRANGLFHSRVADDELRALLDEALALADRRGEAISFAYLFEFDGGRPPWVSGLAQGTAISALSRAAVRLGEPRYFEAARAATGIFGAPPPQGVAVPEAGGTHYLQYSFAPRLRILNGFVQALNGLHDFAVLANDDRGRELFAAGMTALRAELPRYDTGGWSRYSQQRDSDLHYHVLLRDFLRGLCDRTTRAGEDGAFACAAAQRFTEDLTTPPRLALEPVGRPPRARRPARLSFALDKPALVWALLRRGARTVRLSGRFASGRRALAWRPPVAGPWTVRLAATDLAGNSAAIDGVAHVRP